MGFLTLLEASVYLLPAALVYGAYVRARSRGDGRARAALEVCVQAGMTEPSSLHPLIDPSRCIGCGACVRACPEGEVLGVMGGKAAMINPTDCIGHGACKQACPTDAIELVFGTERRGVDIPLVTPDFETNVRGIFIAGELGGMGLVRNAVEQGRQAMSAIAKRCQGPHGADLDAIIVGAGPAGFAASLAALEHGLRFVTVEQETLGGTVAHYPRNKIVRTAPVELPLVGKVRFRDVSKEKLLSFWQGVERKTGLRIHYQERVEAVTRTERGIAVRTSRATYVARTVLLAIGRRGTPRKLGCRGEDLPKVVYRLVDPEQYRGQRVLVVGGGDSALEAAATLAELKHTEVTLSYRGEAFSRARKDNRKKVESAVATGRLDLLLGSQVSVVKEGTVELSLGGRKVELANDAVIVCAGGTLSTGFLREIGIEVETKHGTA